MQDWLANSNIFSLADRFFVFSPKGEVLSSILCVRFFQVDYGQLFKNLP
jgi:hypothetical protein